MTEKYRCWNPYDIPELYEDCALNCGNWWDPINCVCTCPGDRVDVDEWDTMEEYNDYLDEEEE